MLATFNNDSLVSPSSNSIIVFEICFAVVVFLHPLGPTSKAAPKASNLIFTSHQ